jgi:hypothetical protein
LHIYSGCFKLTKFFGIGAGLAVSTIGAEDRDGTGILGIGLGLKVGILLAMTL